MAEILELSEQEFKITMVNLQRVLMGKNGKHERTVV